MEAFKGRSLSLFDFLFCDKSVQKDNPDPGRKKKVTKNTLRLYGTYNILFLPDKIKEETGTSFSVKELKTQLEMGGRIDDYAHSSWALTHLKETLYSF